jgi:hypothetical protein
MRIKYFLTTLMIIVPPCLSIAWLMPTMLPWSVVVFLGGIGTGFLLNDLIPRPKVLVIDDYGDRQSVFQMDLGRMFHLVQSFSAEQRDVYRYLCVHRDKIRLVVISYYSIVESNDTTQLKDLITMINENFPNIKVVCYTQEHSMHEKLKAVGCHDVCRPEVDSLLPIMTRLA